MASDGETCCTNDPNFAVIYSFLKVFGKLYGLEIPTITNLQEYVEDSQEVPEPLKELHLRLLRRALRSVPTNRWERCLIKFCHQHGHHQEAWEIERFSYKKASTQVKLKVLKVLLEYQFTCHPKFKGAVNALSHKELRLDPVGRDRSGCVYWLQVDDEANLCLYKEDQDEETWQLIARNREELVKVIEQLKNGEEISPSVVANANEDSNSAEVPSEAPQPEKSIDNNEEEEFLSPESESDHEPVDKKSNKSIKENTQNETEKEEEKKEEQQVVEEKPIQSRAIEREKSPSPPLSSNPEKEKELILEKDAPLNSNSDTDEMSSPSKCNSPKIENDQITEKDITLKQNTEVPEHVASPEKPEKAETNNEPTEKPPEDEKPSSPQKGSKEVDEELKDDMVSEAIEEPVMVVTGEGNGADCESPYIIGEEITEEVMYFFGEGCGYDNDTGNPEAIEEEAHPAENSGEENGNGSEERVNGETHELSVSNSSKKKSVKNIKLRSKLPSVAKRPLKKQSTDSTEILKPDSKKHCVRNLNKSESSDSNSKNTGRELKRESSVNDQTTDSESPNKNNVKTRNKVKKKITVSRKIKIKESKEALDVAETDNGHDSKTSIIEKRKSSLSSDQDEENQETEKEKSPDKEPKVEDDLPPKKLRLETPEGDNTVSHSTEAVDPLELVNNDNSKDCSDDNVSSKNLEISISQRKKIKASKGKFKRKKNNKARQSEDKNGNDESAHDSDVKDDNVKKNKSLKRTLNDSTLSDRNKSESQSESEDEEPVTKGKRLKIKPKKKTKTSRKKVEEKLKEKNSTDESEEETLYSLAGKKSSKKPVKKKLQESKQKSKPKEKESAKGASSESETPVRQSRRIAQLKIKEEADRRHLEELALREMKMIHKKKAGKEDSDWQASSESGGERARARARARRAVWRGGDSSDPASDSEPLFDPHEPHEEPDLVFTKSDHEFSPESDLESGEPAEPLKRARTLQEEEKDEGFCKQCGSGEQPEWILLCDKCDAGYHASCLKPVLFLIPDGDWYCPQCNHEMLISSLERSLAAFDVAAGEARARAAQRTRDLPPGDPPPADDPHSDASSGSWSSSDGAVYRLRARRQLPVSYRAREYDRLISTAIKEEYVEPTTSAGNQGRGKDISTIIEAAEEEKMRAEREAIEQGKPVEKKARKKQRRKPRKLNSLEVPSEDDDETDEDFKDTGMESSSEEISSSAERESSQSGSSDDLPIQRASRHHKKERTKMTESSPEVKKKKGVFADSSSESAENKEWNEKKNKPKTKSKKSSRSKSRPRGLTQYDATGRVIRARVTYGGLSDDNDWSPKHRTRQRRINYTEMPNTESEDEMHKSSGKHMADSSDEFKIDDSDMTSDSDAEKKKESEESEEKRKAIDELITKTAVVPLEKLPDDVTRAKTEELQAHLASSRAPAPGTPRGRGRGRGGRGRGRPPPADPLASLVGLKIKDLKADGTPRPLDAEREKKRLEREAKQAEKEARKMERLQKKEEKEKLKEQKAKEREEKRLAKLALQESKRMKKEKVDMDLGPRYPSPAPPYPHQPRLQVRAELRGVLSAADDARAPHVRDGTLSVAGSPQPFKPASEEPSVITRMPHMLGQYRNPMMYPPNSYGGRGQMPYGMSQYGAYYAHMRPYRPERPDGYPYARLHGPPRPPGPMAGPPEALSGPGMPPGCPGMPPGSSGMPPGGPGMPPGGPGMPPGGPGMPPGGPGMPTGGPGMPTGGPGMPPSGPGMPPGGPGMPPGGPGMPPSGPGLPSSGPLPPGGSGSMPPAGAGPLPPGGSLPPRPGLGSPEQIQIKAEVKTEPEYRSPAGSPAPRAASPDAPRPKIKVTDVKDRRPRYPLGPYAPQYQYGYGEPNPLLALQARLQSPRPEPDYLHMRPYLRPSHYYGYSHPTHSPGHQTPPGHPGHPPSGHQTPPGHHSHPGHSSGHQTPPGHPGHSQGHPGPPRYRPGHQSHGHPMSRHPGHPGSQGHPSHLASQGHPPPGHPGSQGHQPGHPGSQGHPGHLGPQGQPPGHSASQGHTPPGHPPGHPANQGHQPQGHPPPGHPSNQGHPPPGPQGHPPPGHPASQGHLTPGHLAPQGRPPPGHPQNQGHPPSGPQGHPPPSHPASQGHPTPGHPQNQGHHPPGLQGHPPGHPTPGHSASQGLPPGHPANQGHQPPGHSAQGHPGHPGSNHPPPGPPTNQGHLPRLSAPQHPNGHPAQIHSQHPVPPGHQPGHPSPRGHAPGHPVSQHPPGHSTPDRPPGHLGPQGHQLSHLPPQKQPLPQGHPQQGQGQGLSALGRPQPVHSPPGRPAGSVSGHATQGQPPPGLPPQGHLPPHPASHGLQPPSDGRPHPASQGHPPGLPPVSASHGPSASDGRPHPHPTPQGHLQGPQRHPPPGLPPGHPPGNSPGHTSHGQPPSDGRPSPGHEGNRQPGPSEEHPGPIRLTGQPPTSPQGPRPPTPPGPVRPGNSPSPGHMAQTGPQSGHTNVPPSEHRDIQRERLQPGLRQIAAPPTSSPVPRVKEERPDDAPSQESGGGGVFGGLVSYFSSQHEDDIDS